MEGGDGRLELRRTIAAPPERVFRAWTEAEGLSRWFAPGAATVTRAEADARVGGRWSVTMRGAAGEEWVVSGHFEEVAAPHRVALTWRWAHEPPESVSRVAVELRAVSGGTELRLVHDGLSEASRAGHAEGWTSSLAKLQELERTAMTG